MAAGVDQLGELRFADREAGSDGADAPGFFFEIPNELAAGALFRKAPRVFREHGDTRAEQGASHCRDQGHAVHQLEHRRRVGFARAGPVAAQQRVAALGSTQYFTAWGAAERGYPLLRGDRPGPGETDPAAVLELMHRVTLIPTVRRTLFGPRITVFTKDGRSFTKEGTGREFIWDFEEEARRIRLISAGLAISETQFTELIDTCRHLDRTDRAAEKLIALTIPS